MTHISVYFLSVALFAIVHSVAPAAETPLTGPSAEEEALELSPRSQSPEEALMAPPAIYGEPSIERRPKRDGGDWFWMPAYGFVYLPEIEEAYKEKKMVDTVIIPVPFRYG